MKHFLCLLGSFLSFTLAFAKEPSSLSRDEAIRLAFSRQPGLKVASLVIDRAKSGMRWSGRLENPSLEFSYRNDETGLDEGEQTTDLAFSQRFPVTARLKHEKTLRRHQILLAEAEVAERRRELASEVDRALVDLLASRERLRLSKDSLDLNGEIVAFLEKQAANGEVSKLDQMQATLAGRTLAQDRERLESLEKQQRLALFALIGLDSTSQVDFPDSLALPAKEPPAAGEFDAILRRRPDHVLALAKIDEAAAALVLENAKRWEDIDVKLFVEDEHSVDAPNGMERNTFAGFGISIPLPLRQRNQEGIERARIDGEEARRSVEASRFSIRSECEAAYRARSDAWKLAHETAADLPALAEEQLEEVRKAHANGEATFLQVRQAQEQLLAARRTALDSLADYHLAEARVRLVTGAYPGLESSSQSQK